MPHIHANTPPPSPRLIAGGESSPSSADTVFRELDEVSLQIQTKLWLGEVLQTRLNEHEKIDEMLSDGELLFDVSRTIWEMILTRRIELGRLKPFKYDPFASRRHSGRYTPYCNVDSFLKVCKILGLCGIDLFSPSDVVEKKNTRKVCMCIRLLSMKARSMCLNVPDFDVVTRTASMPTDMVGLIRQSLELSQCRSLGSASYKSRLNISTTKTKQRHFLASNANSSSSGDLDNSNINDVQLESSSVQLMDMSYEDYQQDSPVCCKDSDDNSREEYLYEQNACEPNSIPIDLIRQSVTDEDFWDSTTPEQSCIPCQFGMSRTTNYEHSAEKTEGVTGSCAKNLFSSKTNPLTESENGQRGKTCDESLELFYVSSSNSVLGPLRLDFHDKHDVQLSGITGSKDKLPEDLNTDAELAGDDGVKVLSSPVARKSDKLLLQSEITTLKSYESVYVVGDQLKFATDNDNLTFEDSKIRSVMVSVEESKLSPELLSEDNSNITQKQETSWCIDLKEKEGEVERCNINKGCGIASPHMNKSSMDSEHRHEENAGHRSLEPTSDEDANQPFKPAGVRPQKRQLIKSIASGTAVLSVMLLVLWFRKGGSRRVSNKAYIQLRS